MLIHNFKYSFITLFKNRMLIFWTFAFPIILGTFFNMAFSNIESSEKLDIIDIAIVDNEAFQNDSVLTEVFKELSDKKNEERLFHIEYVNEEKAKSLLSDGEITGYLLVGDDEAKVIVTNSGIQETILKYTVEEILQTKEMITGIMQKEIMEQIPWNNAETDESQNPSDAPDIDYEKIYAGVIDLMDQQNIKMKDISRSNLSYMMIEFYTLIAMTCLYGGILGMVAMNQNLPNMTSIGKRVAVSPVNKIKLVLGSVFAGYVIQLIGVAILFVYTIFVLKVDYGDNLPLIIVLAMAGCLAGLSIGIAVGTLIKSGDNTKTGIIIAVSMVGCFLSGMMGVTMKYLVDTYIPIINKLNPAAMITDGFYSLYYYDTLNRYYFNVASLLIFALIMISLSFISLRRQTYDSI